MAKGSAAATKTRKTRAGRTARASTNFFNSNDDNNSLSGLRVQQVMRLTGVSAEMARVVAPLLFGGAA